MTNLGQLIEEIRHDAATLPTSTLRTEIQASLAVLNEAIGCFNSIRPGTGHLEKLMSAADEVIILALMASLYTQELTTRPAERVTYRVSFSRN